MPKAYTASLLLLLGKAAGMTLVVTSLRLAPRASLMRVRMTHRLLISPTFPSQLSPLPGQSVARIADQIPVKAGQAGVNLTTVDVCF